MFNKLVLIIVLLLILSSSACGHASTSDTMAVETQVAGKIYGQQTAEASRLSPTPVITNTPQPTATPKPTATPELAARIPPRNVYSHPYEVKETYDRFKGETTVSLAPDLLNTRNTPNNWSVFFSYKGETPAPPLSVLAVLWYVADEWTYLNCHSLDLLLDGNTTISPKTEHDGDVKTGYVIERVLFQLTTSEFLQIANAKTVEGKLCNTEFALSEGQIQAMRDTASRMLPKK